MINRVLIRIKAVQILYSFILVEKQFMLESQPSSPTKEKRFAYALYLDMLYLFTRIAANVSRRGGDYPLADTRFIKKLQSDDKIKALDARYRVESFQFASAVEPLAEKIKDSALYKNWLKENSDPLSMRDGIWQNLFKIIIMQDERVKELIACRQNYTLRGEDRMVDMMTVTFENFLSSQDNEQEALSALSLSLNRARELYMRLLTLPVELTKLRKYELDERSKRYLATPEDLNPNLRFVENKLIPLLESNEDIQNYVKNEKLGWSQEDRTMLSALLKAIVESDIYREYMKLPETDLHVDTDLWRNLLRHVVFRNEDFLEYMENKSVFWNDDLDIIGTFVIKTIKRFDEDVARPVLEKFKDEEDARFGSDLIKLVLKHKDLYRGYLDEVLDRSQWDSERLAFMDVIIMITALAEILNFPKIPLNASINEYIEIAKSYSSVKSGQFVNGMLANVIRNLRERNILIGK